MIWDKFIRTFHWQLPLLIPALWFTAENGYIFIHQFLGIWLLWWLLMRLVWGVVGSRFARFSSFVRAPKAIKSYLSGQSSEQFHGHNPLGGLSVIAMFLVILAQLVTGLFAADDFFFEGPLVQFISYDLAEQITELHHALFNAIVVLIALHLAAIVFYALVKKDNLVPAMIHGKKADKAIPKANFSWLSFGVTLLVPIVLVAPILYWAIQNY